MKSFNQTQFAFYSWFNLIITYSKYLTTYYYICLRKWNVLNTKLIAPKIPKVKNVLMTLSILIFLHIFAPNILQAPLKFAIHHEKHIRNIIILLNILIWHENWHFQHGEGIQVPKQQNKYEKNRCAFWIFFSLVFHDDIFLNNCPHDSFESQF